MNFEVPDVSFSLPSNKGVCETRDSKDNICEPQCLVT